MKFDDIVRSLGECGAYQIRVYFLLCLACMSCGIQIMISVFTLGVPEHRCGLPDSANNTTSFTTHLHLQEGSTNTSTPPWGYSRDRTSLSPWSYLGDNTTEVIQCFYQLQDQVTGELASQPCTEWVYDDSIFRSTLVTLFNLVCEDKLARSHARMILMGGLLLGAITIGIIADMVGRKATLMAMVALHCLVGITTAFIKSFILYVILQFLMGVSISGLFLTIFVLGMELVGPSKRLLAGIVVNVFWSIGVMLMGGLAYFIRDWNYLQMAVSFPVLLLFCYWWLIPESPRWLLARGKESQAESIIRHAAKVNGKVLPEKLFDEKTFEETFKRVSIWKIFQAPVFIWQLIILCYNWLVASMVFYGLSLNSGTLAGNIYINFELMGLVEILAYGICLLLLNRVGRKKVHITCMVVGGGACLSTLFTTLYADQSLQWINVVLALTGKCGATAAFAIVYIYSAELFPTVLRNSLMGVTCLFARLGGMISPYVADLNTSVGGEFGQALPYIVFGVSTILGGVLCVFLPETLNRNLPETLDDAINFSRNSCKITEEQVYTEKFSCKETITKESVPLTEQMDSCKERLKCEIGQECSSSGQKSWMCV